MTDLAGAGKKGIEPKQKRNCTKPLLTLLIIIHLCSLLITAITPNGSGRFMGTQRWAGFAFEFQRYFSEAQPKSSIHTEPRTKQHNIARSLHTRCVEGKKERQKKNRTRERPFSSLQPCLRKACRQGPFLASALCPGRAEKAPTQSQ